MLENEELRKLAPVRRLGRHLSRIFADPSIIRFAPSDAVYILVECRQILESEGTKRDFSDLNFFSDWVLHIKLERNLEKKFGTLLDIYTNLREGADGFNLNDKVNDLISIKGLRRDLVRLFERCDLRTDFLEDREAWYGFIDLLMPELISKPLEFFKKQDGKWHSNKNRDAFQRSQLATGIFSKIQLKGVDGDFVRWEIVEILQNNEERLHTGTIARTEAETDFGPSNFEVLK